MITHTETNAQRRQRRNAVRCRRCGTVLTAPDSIAAGAGDCCQPTQGVLARVRVATSGCWEWTGRIAHEYGIIQLIGNKREYAHRFLYRVFRGPIQDGLELHHTCHIKHCVNPWHLEPLTRREHILRGTNHIVDQMQRTHCPKGHAYTEENTYQKKASPNKRECRRCHNDRQAAAKRRRRIARLASGVAS